MFIFGIKVVYSLVVSVEGIVDVGTVIKENPLANDVAPVEEVSNI